MKIYNYELFKKRMENLIQESGLDIGGALFVMKDVTHRLEEKYIEQINVEIREEEGKEGGE